MSTKISVTEQIHHNQEINGWLYLERLDETVYIEYNPPSADEYDTLRISKSWDRIEWFRDRLRLDSYADPYRIASKFTPDDVREAFARVNVQIDDLHDGVFEMLDVLIDDAQTLRMHYEPSVDRNLQMSKVAVAIEGTTHEKEFPPNSTLLIAKWVARSLEENNVN
jgi:hypothetical protein